jgi:hypothetical protein
MAIVRLRLVPFKSREGYGILRDRQGDNDSMTAHSGFLNPYARFVGNEKPLAVLAATTDRLRNLAEMIGPRKISAAPAPAKWSAAEILCHLADCEIAFAFRLRQTLAEESHVIQPFDQDKWAGPYEMLAADEALAAFAALRRWNLLLIEGALPHHASKPVSHPERGAMTFGTIVETMAGHDLNHIGQLERIAGC